MRIDCWIACVLMLVASSLAAANSTPALPDGIDADDWAQIQQQIQAQRFHAQASDVSGGWQAANPAHGFHIDYQPGGQTVLTLAGEAAAEHRIALQLQGYGYGDALIPLTQAPVLSANGNTVTYQWKPGLREWWINNEQGLAQWFELAERPTMDSNAQPLVVSMTLDTGLNASVADNALTLSASDNGTTITYDRLKVWDATGRVLPAEMALDGRRLALHVDDREAVYPVTIDPTFTQQAYLKASNTEAGDRFGSTVAVAGDIVAVGARFEDSSATGGEGDNSAENAGAVYVFVRDGVDGWAQQAFLKASNAETTDRFGWSVALSSNTLVVGAPFEDSSATGGESDNSVTNAGAVYVFVRSGTNWSQQAYLKASSTDRNDRFGESVAIDGDSLVVGAPWEDSSATGGEGDNSASRAGAAYVFVRSGTTWTQQAFLKASNAEVADFFGRSVAIDGDTLVVGALEEDSSATGGEDDNSAENAGAAYVFTRSGTTWTQQAFLKASNAETLDRFGTSVAVADDTVVVGAPFEDSAAARVNGNPADNSASNAGAAYVFVRSGTSWSQQAYLKASNARSDAGFGDSIAIDDNVVNVGAPFEDSSTSDEDNSLRTPQSGAAYVFVRSGMSWAQQDFLKASNIGFNDTFGTSVAVSGAIVVVGASAEASAATGVNGDQADDSASVAGAAYVLEIAYTVGGTVAGLNGSGLVLRNNGGDDLAITADGAFTFGTALDEGSAYAVTVTTQPTDLSQTCTVTNGSGTLGGSDITDVQIECVTDLFTVGGTVTGLNGAGLVLQNNAGDDLPITADGAFSFPTALADGSAYAVNVVTQPTDLSQTCTVTNGSGTLSGADITDITVNCVTDTFTVGGTVNGLVGTGLVLQNNGGDDLPIAANGGFTFPTALDDGSAYAATVLSQPADQICTVSNGSGALAGNAITAIEINCVLIAGINILPEVLDFGDQPLGVPTAARMAVVESTGPADLVIASIALEGPQAADFQITTDSCSGATLPVDDACGIDVVFTAGAAGVRAAWIRIPSNVPDSPGRLNLLGTSDVIFFDGLEAD